MRGGGRVQGGVQLFLEYLSSAIPSEVLSVFPEVYSTRGWYIPFHGKKPQSLESPSIQYAFLESLLLPKESVYSSLLFTFFSQ